LGGLLRVSLGYDPISQRKYAKHGTPPPPKTFPQDNPAEPGPKVRLVFERLTPSPGDHECVLQSVFRRAQIIQNEIRELQHGTRASAERAYEGSSRICLSSGNGVVAHAATLIER
jgi:hypothetical protein